MIWDTLYRIVLFFVTPFLLPSCLSFAHAVEVPVWFLDTLFWLVHSSLLFDLHGVVVKMGGLVYGQRGSHDALLHSVRGLLQPGLVVAITYEFDSLMDVALVHTLDIKLSLHTWRSFCATISAWLR
jgi:hypothetical protein